MSYIDTAVIRNCVM